MMELQCEKEGEGMAVIVIEGPVTEVGSYWERERRKIHVMVSVGVINEYDFRFVT